MTLQQLDGALKSWKERLSTIAENLLELQTDTTYQLLTGTGGLTQVVPCGETAARVNPALRTMNELFVRFGLLQAVIDRADKVRQGMPSFFASESRLRAVEQLLFARSIEIPAEAIPLAERGLLSDGPQWERWTPDELLQTMSATFLQIRDAVAAVAEAWSHVSAWTEQADFELADLREQTLMPGHVLDCALQKAEAQLARVREQAHADPIGALGMLKADPELALEAVRARVRLAEQVQHSLHKAQATWSSIEVLHAAAVHKSAQLKGIIQSGSTREVEEPVLEGLRQWLNRLDRKRDDGVFEPVMVGLRNWTRAAEAILVQDRAVVTQCEAQLASRSELCGRLEALQAKARSRGLACHAELAGLCSSAEALLYTRPTDLARAAEAIARFEDGLRSHQVQAGQPIMGRA